MNSSFAPDGPRTRNSEIISCPSAICASPSIITIRPAKITETRNDLDMPVFSFKGGPTMFSVAENRTMLVEGSQRNLQLSLFMVHACGVFVAELVFQAIPIYKNKIHR